MSEVKRRGSGLGALTAAAMFILSSCGNSPRIIVHDLSSVNDPEKEIGEVQAVFAETELREDITSLQTSDDAVERPVSGTFGIAETTPETSASRTQPSVTYKPASAAVSGDESFSPMMSSEPAPETTEESTVTAASTPAAPAESSAAQPKPSAAQTASDKSSGGYSYEFQTMNGTAMILGPNLVYVGESFDFNFTYPDISDNSNMIWSVEGDCGTIEKNGLFTARKKGDCIVKITDTADGTFAALHVHCIVTADDVDFIPLVNNIPIANKTYPLPKDYDPGFSPSAKSALGRMQAAASAEGLNLYAISGYRSYDYQKEVYAGWVKLYGSDADLVSARPGHSEHQLGLAVDLNACEYAFADTPEGKWLKAHCAEYGFILRYPSNEARAYTGYSYEPWHIRYVGTELAKTVTESGKTLEELLGIDSYYR
ncbi:MAG: M15 family metallopeptidase [Ruminiclostridium sp.]|nr:M15 family metallopeptidase [Ruminiclostridium sp.]